MIKTVKIGGGEVILAANAATPYRYKQVFGEDLFQILAASPNKTEEENITLTDTITKLTYIMSKQAEKADMSALSVDGFYSWLEDYAPLDIVFAGEEIISFYMSSTQGTVTAKKN